MFGLVLWCLPCLFSSIRQPFATALYREIHLQVGELAIRLQGQAFSSANTNEIKLAPERVQIRVSVG
ncbi:hypothetical protein CPB86DRAFT_789282 [Serendipita vermifera]|nr:hypothetical protein CPB86DRAFT_789282 [Serendipita vermifera]